MSQKIQPYPTLAREFVHEPDLLEQVRLRDKLISDFRLFLLSWDIPVPMPTRWKKERDMLLQAARDVLEAGVSKQEETNT